MACRVVSVTLFLTFDDDAEYLAASVDTAGDGVAAAVAESVRDALATHPILDGSYAELASFQHALLPTESSKP